MSKYQQLTDYLLSRCNQQTVELTFEEIENLIYPNFLPSSAYIYREWWANDSYHSQAKSWYKAEFSVCTVTSRTVIFRNHNCKREPVITNNVSQIQVQPIKLVECPKCKQKFGSNQINAHITHKEEKYFGNSIKFQSSKFVCFICYGIIKDFSPETLQFHRLKKCKMSLNSSN